MNPRTEEGADYEFHEGKGLELHWEFWDKQLKVIDAVESGDYDVVVYRGGYGSGKTVLGARLTVEKALANPGGHSLVLAQDFSKGGATTYQGFFKQLPGKNTVPDDAGGNPENSPIVAGYNQNDHRLTYINGHVTRLGSADKWNRYAGAEFGWIWCDEIAHYSNTDLYKLNEMLISRQRTKQGPNVSLWTSTGSGYNQFFDFVSKQVDKNGDPLRTRIKNVVADSRDNPFLMAKDKIIRQFEGTAREEEALAGGFSAAEGLVWNVSRELHVVNEKDLDLELDWRVYGYDAGWSDPRVMLEIGRTRLGQLVVLEEYYEEKSHVDDVLNWMDGRPRGTIYAEHEPVDIERMRNQGWPVEKAEKSLDAGISEVRDRFDTDRDGRPGLLVLDSCTATINELLSYQEDEVGTSTAVDHACDSLRYAVMGVESPDDSDEVRSYNPARG